MERKLKKPDYLFEVSWEVCNKVGGIHTVIATKATSLLKDLDSNYILIGPDIVRLEGENPEFTEDPQIYSAWKQYATSEGFRIKIGRWNINGSPIAVLIDFSNMFQHKDDIFSKLWEKYKLDSISGQWDYIEPALFGYAAGSLIESFVQFNLTEDDSVVAQFHEWMTGGGILYLREKLPQVATIFTTHATVLGRSLAGNNRPLYKNLENFNTDVIAKEFNVLSKQSLEKLSAQQADAFTTVSEITARECKHFLQKPIDFVTPNGFEDTFVPEEPLFTEKRENARNKIIQVAEALLGKKLGDNPLLVATSGRYEFKNKGIDLFIDSLGEINKSAKLNREIVALVLIPANHYGMRKDLHNVLNGETSNLSGSRYLTHNLHDAEWDPILTRIKAGNLNNSEKDKVKIFFVPSYLNGYDGIFNLPYYDLLIGLDLTVFASYYEPWGYTPLESLAFKVPTVTTTLAGFGLWVNNQCEECGVDEKGISVIERNDENDKEVTENIAKEIINKINFSADDNNIARESAFKISKVALWKTLISNYKEAFDFALQKVETRSDSFVKLQEKQTEKVYEYVLPLTNEPEWKRIIVKSKLPDKLKAINEIIENLWWTWDEEAQDLFEIIDREIWHLSDRNPVILFEQVPYDKLVELANNKDYIAKLERVYARYKAYMSEGVKTDGPRIAYFSMEYGIHDSLKIYSGGLGLLAGDYLKEASDAKINLVGVGLLYRYGYFTQVLTLNGDQEAHYDFQHFSKIPVKPVKDENGNFKTISIVLPGRTMHARIWEVNIGRIKLYLLDTDFEDNQPEDRTISHHLYGGDNENRLKQELLLGIGGIRALDILGLEFDLFHSNEGHSAFIGLERMRNYILNEQLTFPEAKEIVRSTTLFTTHTPVPAGHDQFDEDLLRKYIGHYPERLKIDWNEFMALGRSNPNNWQDKFNMSFLAAHLAQEVNGVSMLHGDVTREMFAKLWPGYLPEELHISYVTNGVHFPTWKANEWNEVYNRIFDNDYAKNCNNKEAWNKIHDVSDKEIWDVKQKLRTRLISGIKQRFEENWIKRHEDPKQIIAIRDALSDQVLTVCFARRFATYKRAHLLFRNLDRLSKLVNDPKMPIQFIFAGKAHPNDKAGQDLIKMIVEISKRPEFLGKILFLQNYDISLAKYLVQGSDIWMNTPTRPLEASGTSGEKAVMNGTLHFSVLDGWWVEGYRPEAGWALTNERTYENQGLQDDLDAEIIYSMFEHEIVPLFYKRNKEGISPGWVKFIKNSMASVAPGFTTSRMLNEYFEKFYNKLYERSKAIRNDDFEMAKKLSSWKKRISRGWNNIEVLGVKLYDKNTETLQIGQGYHGEVILDLNEVSPNYVGVELVITENGQEFISRELFNLVKYDAGKAYYEADISINQPGTFTYGLRVFAKNDMLPHRQDFPVLKWI